MADEIAYTGLGNQRLTNVLSTEYELARTDTNWFMSHPAIWKYPQRLNGSGSTTVKVPRLGLDGYDAFAAQAEGDTVANTALTDDAQTITIARQSFRREPSGVAMITDPLNVLNAPRFVRDFLGAYNARLANMFAALMSGFSTGVGTSGSDLTLANFLAAKSVLLVGNAMNGVPILSLLHGQQWSDLSEEITTTSGGSVQLSVDAQGMLQWAGAGFQGRFLNVDIFVSNRINTANGGADYAGGMFTRGAVGWADALPVMDDPTQQVMVADVMLFERARNAAKDQTAYIGHAYMGVAELDDGRGVKIVTDA